jgi:hypothetical protein
MMIPRGLRNNNPLNIRHSVDSFQGEIKGTDSAFKTFISMAYGYRAAFVILHTYFLRGLNTIEKIVTRWAPPNENNTAGYIANVEKWSGVSRHKVLTLADGVDYRNIAAAMCRAENGQAANMADVTTGFNLQIKIKMQ